MRPSIPCFVVLVLTALAAGCTSGPVADSDAAGVVDGRTPGAGVAPAAEEAPSVEEASSVEDEGAAIKAVLDAYFAVVRFPEPADIDPELFAPDVYVLWSKGESHVGRDAVVAQLEKGKGTFEATFESLTTTLRDVEVHVHGDFAWVTALVHLDGTGKGNKAPLDRDVRATFVLEKSDGRWRIVHEHDSQVLRMAPPPPAAPPAAPENAAD